MDSERKLREWLKKMEYPGKIPVNLSKLCNPATAPLWEQIVQRIKPRDEIRYIKNNLIINRVSKQKNSECNDQLNSLHNKIKAPIKEIEVWKEKNKLEEEKKSINERIIDNDKIIQDLENQNKLKYLQLENVKMKKKEMEQRLYLLKQKIQALEQEINNANDLLSLGKNLTPIETTENQSNADILNTLNKCAEKLEVLAAKQKYSTKNNRTMMTPMNKFGLDLSTAGSGTELGATPSSNLSKMFFSLRKPNFIKIPEHPLASIKKRLDRNQRLDDSLGILNDVNSSVASDLLSITTLSEDVNAVEENDAAVKETGKILYNYPRFLIWKILADIHEKLRVELVDAIVPPDHSTRALQLKKKDDNGIKKLYAMHIEFELQTIKSEINIKKLEHQLMFHEKQTFDRLPFQSSMLNKAADFKEMIKFQRQEVGLTSVITYLQKEANALKGVIQDTEELTKTIEKQNKIEEQMQTQLTNIDYKLGLLKGSYVHIFNAQEEAKKVVRKLHNFTEDMSWITALSEHRISSELSIFFQYPIEYNRKVSLANGNKFYAREVFNDSVPNLGSIDTNTVQMLSSLINCPSLVPEQQLLQIVNMQKDVNNLKLMPEVVFEEQLPNYSLQDLKEKESYSDSIIEKLHSMKEDIMSKSSTTCSSLSDNMKFSLEMPIKKYISSKRLYNNQPYEYYDKLYHDLYRNL